MTPLSARSQPRRSLDALAGSTRRLRERVERPGTMSARRAGAKRTLLDTIRQLPHYLRLLGGLLVDRRVSMLDKALVAGAIAYIVSPLDLIPDVVPFLGQVDDVFLLMTAIERLVAHAGAGVIRDHWHGSRAELETLDVKAVLGAAVLFLPGGVRTKLVRLVRNRRHRDEE